MPNYKNHITQILNMLIRKLPDGVSIRTTGVDMNARVLTFENGNTIPIRISYKDNIIISQDCFVIKTEEDVLLFLETRVKPLLTQLPILDDLPICQLTVGQFKQLLTECNNI